MRRNHPLFRHGPLAASLCAFLAASVLASTSVGPEPGDLPAPPVMADNDTLRIEATAPAAQPAVRQDQRVIQITGSNREVHLWNQRALDGSLTSHYAIMERRAGDAAASIVGRERQTSYDIGLRYASFDPRIATPGMNAQLLAPANNELFLVQFWAVPLDEMRAEIEAMGGKIYRFLEDHTHIVRMPSGIADNVRRLNYVRWVGPFHPAYKLDEQIISAFVKNFPGGGVEGAREGVGEWFTKGEYSIEVFERAGGKPVIEQLVEARDVGIVPPAPQRPAPGDLGQQAVVRTAILAMGGSVSVVTPGGFRMQAHLAPDQLIRVARMNEVHVIEPWGFGGHDMNLVRQIGGANFIENTLGITGQGVRAEVFDIELRTTHQEFTNNAPLIHSAGTAGSPPHGTSVYSVMFARGASANARGLLPDADQGIFFRHSESTQFGGAKTRLTIAQELLGGTYAAVLQTSSVGNTRTFFYTSISAEMDDVIFVSQLLHTQSQSNAGNQDSRPQAWAKNIVSGGAVNHFNTASRNDDTFLAANCGNFFGGTSTGPAQDGRIKPDLSFFYDCTVAAANSSNTAYTQFGGTSGATPSVAGYMGLFHQMWHENTWEGSGELDGTGGGHTVFTDRPSPMLPKAALINSAFRYDWNSGGANGSLTRFVQGWGMPNLQTLYDARDKTYYADEPFILRQGQSKSHTINVAAGEPQLNVTMAYLDPMGTTSATTHRINDVSLKVTSPAGTVYWGNNGLSSGNFSTSGGSSNTKDTVENVFIANPDAGKWTVEILGDVVVQDAHVETAATDVDYALWVTGGTESGSIKTTFRSGNGNAGAMFDITAHEDITISGFDIQHRATASITIEVYSVAGGFAGNETNPAAWTLMGSQILTPNGEGAATHVSIGGLSIAAGQTFGLYVTGTAGAGTMSYSNGRETWDNGEVAISTGVGKFYPFGGTSLGRSWNGVVYYDLLAAGVGPYAFSIQSNGDDQLYRIDLTTGSTQSMGAAMGLNDAEGLTMMPNGTLLAIGGSVDELWNVTSPPGSFIGATGSRTGSDAGLDYSEAGRALYNLNAGLGASSLYRVNPNNGAIALIGNSTIFADNLAIDKTGGNAYAIDGVVTDSLYSVDLTNGSLTLIGSLGLGNISVQFGTAFLGDTLYALDSNGNIYTINTSTGAATLRTTIAVGGWEGLAIPCSAARFMPTEGFGSTFSSPTHTRGYWFEAPTDFLITGLRVPDESGAGVQNVEVMRFNVAIPSFPGTTNRFTSLFRAVDVANNSVIHTSIPVGEGDIIGILGAAGTTTMHNSYGTSTAGVPIEIFGQPATATRMGMQFNLNATPAKDIFTESGLIARVEMYYTDVPDVFLDADSAATGQNLDTTPLVTSFGTITATRTVEIGNPAMGNSDLEFTLAGAGENHFDIINPPTSEATMTFDFDVDSLTFVYGGNSGVFSITAFDAANNVVDQFFQADTGIGLPAGPQTIAGSGIRMIVWTDTGFSFSAMDNIKIMAQPCPCACDFDPDPACDIFDFLAFQNLFVGGDPCACDMDPDPACDIFDFLAFQNEFVGGCP